MLRYVIVIRLFFLLPTIMLKTANATAPMGYPDVPHFGYLTHYQAVWNL